MSSLRDPRGYRGAASYKNCATCGAKNVPHKRNGEPYAAHTKTRQHRDALERRRSSAGPGASSADQSDGHDDAGDEPAGPIGAAAGAADERVVARVRELAAERELPLSHLPDRAGVARSHFWDVLAGRKSPTLRWLERIAAALEVEVPELLSSSPPPPSDTVAAALAPSRPQLEAGE